MYKRQALGFEYLSATTKDEFTANIPTFTDPSQRKQPIIFEVFTSDQDENVALKMTRNLVICLLYTSFGMAVGFYTSRVFLNTLGAEDCGLQNVVGGVIGMLHILIGALTTSTQRYLTFGLGKGDTQRLNEVFMTSWFIHLFLAIIALIVAETAGLWFVREKLVIPSERMYEAEIVLSLIHI